MKKHMLNQILELLDKMNSDLKEEIGKKADKLDVKKLSPKFGKILELLNYLQMRLKRG